MGSSRSKAVEVDLNSLSLRQFVSDPALDYFLGTLEPPQARVEEFFAILQAKHYRRGSSRESLFRLRKLIWADITWGIVGVPSHDRQHVNELAAEFRLYFSSWVPMVAGSEVQIFPVTPVRMFTLTSIAG